MTYAEIALEAGLKDIDPIRAGVAFASVRNGCPPRKLGHTLIHYVSKGRGLFFIDGKTYTVSAGQAFIIPAGHLAHYRSSREDPWGYRWVCVVGALSHSFENAPRVLTLPDTFLKILQTTELPDLPRKQVKYAVAADLYFLFARFCAGQPEAADDMTRCVYAIADHIHLNYAQKLSIEGIAQQFNYDRTYLCKQFKKRMGCSIQYYILDVRLQRATSMLVSDLTIKEVVSRCGFSHVSNFTKAFTKQFNMTPTEFKQMMLDDYEAFRNSGAE